MRICILTQYYLPEIGAPQARLSELANHFLVAGDEVVVLTAMPNYPTGKIFNGYKGFFRKEIIDAIDVIRCYIFPSKSIRFLPRLWNYFSFVISSMVIGILKLPKFDILITESPPLFLGISGYVLSKLKGARWIFNVSDLWPESAVNLGIVSDGILLKMANILEAFCYRKSWLVTGQSREIIRNIQQRFPDVSTYRLSNGVDIQKFHPKYRSDILKKWAKPDYCTVVYAGLHGIAQGIDQIIEAAGKLQNDGIKVQFLLIGDGPEKDKLKKLATRLTLSNLHFIDPMERDCIPEVWASADIAVIPLKQYIPGAVPSKLYEAMASALPIVMVAEGEPADIVCETECGLVVKPGDINGIVNAIRPLSESLSVRQEMGNKGRAKVINSFSRYGILSDFCNYLDIKLT